MRISRRLPGIRFISYITLTMAVTIWLIFVLNIVFIGVLLYEYNHYRPVYISGGEVMEEMTFNGSGYELSDSMQEKLRGQNQWAMLIDDHGNVIWSFDKPAEIKNTYSQSDIARMSRWYLQDYPIHLRVWEDRIMVVGQPKDTVWKYNMEMPVLWIDFFLKVCLWMLLINFLCILAISFFFTRRWSRGRERARIEWISGISHDIRTPLSMVMGYSDTLSDSENLSPQERQQMAAIRHQSLVMKELVEDLNLTSRLEYSMQPLHVEMVRPAAVLREVAADFLEDAEEGELEIEVEISERAEGVWVRADRKLLVRALRNLFHNSIQHNEQKKTMVIRLCMWKEGKWCVISFSDNGTGYSPEILRQLQSRKRKRTMQNIRGLGIVQKVVLAHGGKIRFENVQKGGSFCEMRLQGYEGKKVTKLLRKK